MSQSQSSFHPVTFVLILVALPLVYVEPARPRPVPSSTAQPRKTQWNCDRLQGVDEVPEQAAALGLALAAIIGIA